MENKTKYAVRAWVFFLITIFRPGPVHGQGGVPLWTNRYAGPSNINSFASALVVDSSGKVYVTGNSGTVAYSGAGLPLWTNASEFGARAIAVDSKDNVFLTGGSWNGVSLDFVTIKYSGEGVP